MKLLLRVSLLLLVLVSMTVVLTSCGGGGGGIISAAVTLTRVSFSTQPAGGPALALGRVKIPFNSDLTSRKYINVVIDLNADGVYSNYTVNGNVQQEWIVQDSSAMVLKSEPNSYSFAFYDTDADSRSGMTGYAVLTDTAFGTADWDGSAPAASVASVTFVVGSVGTETRNYTMVATDGAITGFGSSGSASANPPTEGPGRLMAADSFNSFHAGVPNIQQGHNECVPTSAANNLRWLAEENGWTDKLPSNADMITALKGDLNWGADYGVYTKTDFISGKTKFCDDNDLPIETHQIGADRGRDLPKKISEEMEKGQAIEVVISFWNKKADGTWERKGGHMVSAVGTWTAGSSTFLDFHDPGTESVLDIYKVSDTEFNDSLTLPGYAPPYSTIIEEAYAQSPTVVTPSECSALADLLISMNTTGITDPSAHLSWTGHPLEGNPLQFSLNGSAISISGSGPFVSVSGTANGCTFSATGSGTVAGYPNISVSMDGSVSGSAVSGTYSMGSSGGLPGGNPITFSYSGNL